jgi:transcriptional regulator with XRE-family HTH domain
MDKVEIPAINLRIREVRHTLGLSQAKFSSIVSLSSGYLARVETGHIAANDRLIKLVCSSFGVNEAYLRGNEGAMFQEDLEDGKFKNLITSVRALPPKYQDFLFTMLDMLLKMKDAE